MKFVLLVEGATEKQAAADFLKRWLDPKLKQSVGIQVISFQGYSELSRKLVQKARAHLDGPRAAEIIAVVGLLDLYGPAYPSNLTLPAERFEWGVAHFEREVARPKFRMFFAVHEFEAWLLSQPDIFPHQLRSAFPGKAAQPENVNFDEPPAKLLERIYRQRMKQSYKKVTYGKELFSKLDPAVAVAKCPQLKSMLDELLKMAKDAGL